MTATLETGAAKTPVTLTPGLLSRLGVWSATHLRYVLTAWLVVLAVIGAFGAQVEQRLSGAGGRTTAASRCRPVRSSPFQGLRIHFTVAGDAPGPEPDNHEERGEAACADAARPDNLNT